MSLKPENEALKEKSLFSGSDYLKVFELPSARYRLKNKERILWKGHDPFVRYFTIIFIFLCVVAVGTMLYYLFYDVDNDNGLILIIFMSSPIIAGFLVFLPVAVVLKVKSKSTLKERKPILTDEFISRSARLDKSQREIIKATRDTLGALYSLDPAIIYPEDTPGILEFLISRRYLPPYQFELVLGTVRRLGMTLSDNEVDKVGMNVSESSINVEGLIYAMCLELANVAKKQQECLMQDEASHVLEHIKDKGHVRYPIKKTWKQKLLLSACLGFIFFLLALQALIDIKKEEGVDTILFLFVLIAMAIFGFLLGLVGQFIVAVVNRYKILRKVKHSIYFAIFCMVIALIRASKPKENFISTDTLISILIAGACGFFGVLLLKRIAGLIGLYRNPPLPLTKEQKRIKQLIRFLTDSSPAKSYFLHITKDMIARNENIRTIPKTHSLPDVTGYDKPETPLYGELVNWLKELAGLEPRSYDAIEDRVISLTMGEKDDRQIINVGIEFCDQQDNPYVTLKLQ